MKKKPCLSCGVVQLLSAYHRNARCKDGHASQCKACKSAQMQDYQQQRNKRQYAATRRHYHQIVRERVFAILGKKCQLCGCAELIFLTVDHTTQCGTKHRKQMGHSGYGVYFEILRNPRGTKKQYRTLCMNCNLAVAMHTHKDVKMAIKREHQRIRSNQYGS